MEIKFEIDNSLWANLSNTTNQDLLNAHCLKEEEYEGMEVEETS